MSVGLEFTVHGLPRPQGSKVVLPHGGVRESSRGLDGWRRAIGQRAGDAMAGRPLVDGPVDLEVLFRLPRPQGHYGTGRNAEQLKPSAPKFPATRPDLDKLLRAVCDALTGVVWRTDAAVIGIRAAKLYADHGPAGAAVTVVELLR